MINGSDVVPTEKRLVVVVREAQLDGELAAGAQMTTALRILIAHCRYRERGGEDMVVDAESESLKKRGHTVRLYERDNQDVDHMSRAQLACESIWSARTSRDMSSVLAEFLSDIVHVHNTFPLISPSLYWAVDHAGIPLVQTLHNFRLLCPQAMLLRDGHVCEDCVGKRTRFRDRAFRKNRLGDSASG